MQICNAGDVMSVCKVCEYSCVDHHIENEDPRAQVCIDCAEMISNAFRASISGSGSKKAYISKKLRQQVYMRDGKSCVLCGVDSDLTCDHVYPESKGGATTLDNLQTLCRSCNSKKGVTV